MKIKKLAQIEVPARFLYNENHRNGQFCHSGVSF